MPTIHGVRVVFLKGVNVGGHKTFRPSEVAKQLAKYGVVNVGAAGNFVVRERITEAKLRRELRRCLSFETETMICPGNDILRLETEDPFAGELCGPEMVRFVGVLAKGPCVQPTLPLNLPAGDEWLVRVIAVRGRFAIGLYRRAMRTISLLGQLERRLGGSITIRNWNTFTKIIQVLRTQRDL
jgi:uncharacterized protein (DUF1697 family)